MSARFFSDAGRRQRWWEKKKSRGASARGLFPIISRPVRSREMIVDNEYHSRTSSRLFSRDENVSFSLYLSFFYRGHKNFDSTAFVLKYRHIASRASHVSRRFRVAILLIIYTISANLLPRKNNPTPRNISDVHSLSLSRARERILK